MNTQKTKTPNQSQNNQHKKLFFNETQDEYEDPKITLPTYLQHPSQQSHRDLPSDLTSRQTKKSSDNNKVPQFRQGDSLVQSKPQTGHVGSSPSRSVPHETLVRGMPEGQVEQSEDSSEFSLTEMDFSSTLNIEYRLICLITMVQNYKEELQDEGILEGDLISDIGRQRFLLMQFHAQTIEKCYDEDRQFNLWEYERLMNEQQNLRQFLFHEYPLLEVDEDEQVLKYETMTDEEYAQEYIFLFDEETIQEILEQQRLMGQFDYQFEDDFLSPHVYSPFKPPRPKGPGPLDAQLKNTNFFQNIDQFSTNRSSESTNKAISQSNQSFQVNIRKDKTTNPSKTNQQTKSNSINLFNISSLSINTNPPSKTEANFNNYNQVTFQKFLSTLQEQKNKQNDKKEEEKPPENKTSHFDKILGREGDVKSQTYLKPFVGNFSKKEDSRQQEIFNSLSQTLKSSIPTDGSSDKAGIQFSNQNEPQKKVTENRNPFELQGSNSYLSQQSKDAIGRDQSQITVANLSNNQEGQVNKNIVYSQQVSTPNFNNALPSSRSENLSMSPPSFSNLSQFESSSRNPFDPNHRLNGNIQKGSIQNPFQSSLILQPVNPSKPLLNSNNFTNSAIAPPQSPFLKKIDQNIPQTAVLINSPLSKNQQNYQTLISTNLNTPQTPKFGAPAISQSLNTQAQNYSNKNHLATKNTFESTNKGISTFNEPKTLQINRGVQKEERCSINYRNSNQLIQSALSNKEQFQPNALQNNFPIAINGQANLGIQNQANFKVQIGANQLSNLALNCLSNNVSNSEPIIAPIATNFQVSNPSHPSNPEVTSTNLIILNCSKEMAQTQRRVNHMRNESEMKPQEQTEEDNNNTSKKEKLVTAQSKPRYTQQQIMNMKVSDFINGFCRSEMDSLYKDLFEQLLITRTFKGSNSLPIKSLNSKIISLEQSLLDNPSTYNNYRELTKRTIFNKLRYQQNNEKTLLNDAPFQIMNQINAKLQTAINSSMKISTSFQAPDKKSQINTPSCSLTYRQFSFDEDLSQVQKIQNEITTQLQELEQKIQTSILRQSPPQNDGHIYLSLNEELVSMINAIKNTEKWLVQNDFCLMPLENVSVSSETKLKVENKVQNETEDFKALKTVYKNLSSIEENVSSMSQVLPLI